MPSKNCLLLYVHIIVSFISLLHCCPSLLVKLNVTYLHSINKLKDKKQYAERSLNSHVTWLTNCVIGANGSASYKCSVKSLDAHSMCFCWMWFQNGGLKRFKNEKAYTTIIANYNAKI